MSEPPPPVPAPPPPPRSPAAPLFCWLVVQFLALSLGALRIPLSARFPPPGEQFAIHIVLVAQVVASALLFPLIMRDVKTSVMVILTTVPFVQLASYLSAIDAARAALAAAYVATWLAVLAAWRPLLRTRGDQMRGVACAVALSLGAAIIWYVRAETRASAPIDWSHDGLFGPVLGAIAQVEASAARLTPWFITTTLLILGAATHFATQRRAVGGSGNPSDAS